MPSGDEHGYVLTVRDVFERWESSDKAHTAAINELKTTAETTLAVMRTYSELQDGNNKVHADLDARLRALERWRYALPGVVMASVLTFGVAIADVIVRVITHG